MKGGMIGGRHREEGRRDEGREDEGTTEDWAQGEEG